MFGSIKMKHLTLSHGTEEELCMFGSIKMKQLTLSHGTKKAKPKIINLRTYCSYFRSCYNNINIIIY